MTIPKLNINHKTKELRPRGHGIPLVKNSASLCKMLSESQGRGVLNLTEMNLASLNGMDSGRPPACLPKKGIG